MKKMALLAVILLLAANTVGCEHSKAYLVDRGRDAADIFTLTVGLGAGARARIGPLHAGLAAVFDLGGLRGGRVVDYAEPSGHAKENAMTVETTVSSYETFGAYPPILGEPDRFKEFEARGLPFVSYVEPPRYDENGPLVHPYYTQVELVVALVAGVRLGANPGEMLDFLFGWVGVDIFKDDAEMKRAREELPGPSRLSDS